MRSIWSGAISFGLVNIPVDLISGEKKNDLKFNLVDSRDKGKIRYERINEDTGEEVPWNQITKAYEYADDQFVLISKEDFKNADVNATKTIDIDSFIASEELDAIYYEKPYFVRPRKGGEKAYVLLRKALQDTEKIAIARVVIRTREYLSAIYPMQDLLVMMLLRYAQEIKQMEALDLPDEEILKEKEIDLAISLIDQMTEAWQPEKFVDEYRQALMKMIESKIEGVAPSQPEDEEESESKVIDILDLLQKSVSIESSNDAKVNKTNGRSVKKKAAARKKTNKATKKTS